MEDQKKQALPGIGPRGEHALGLLSGKNAAFVKRVAKQQYEKYGNYDIIDVYGCGYKVTVEIGENWITFSFGDPAKETPTDSIGIGQGCRYHRQMEEIAIEARRVLGGSR